MEFTGMPTVWTATPSLAVSPNRPSACPSTSTDASPTCWCCICARWRRVRDVSCHAAERFLYIFIYFVYHWPSFCSWRRGGAEEELVGELVSEGDRVRDRLRGGAGQQEGSDREGPPQAGALCASTVRQKKFCNQNLDKNWPRMSVSTRITSSSSCHRRGWKARSRRAQKKSLYWSSTQITCWKIEHLHLSACFVFSFTLLSDFRIVHMLICKTYIKVATGMYSSLFISTVQIFLGLFMD